MLDFVFKLTAHFALFSLVAWLGYRVGQTEGRRKSTNFWRVEYEKLSERYERILVTTLRNLDKVVVSLGGTTSFESSEEVHDDGN